MNYAVNIGDMTKDFVISQILLKPHIAGKEIVKTEKAVDGMAVLLNCDNETVVNIIDVVRLKYSKNSFRFYESKTGKSWKRI